MDNLGDWIYIVFLIIAGISGLLSSGKKKNQSKEILGRPGNDIPEPAETNPEKGFWEVLQEMQKEQPKPATTRPKVTIRNKQKQNSEVAQKVAPTPFLAEENKIPESVVTTSSSTHPLSEEENGIVSGQTFHDMEELRKAIICAEILNRKY